MPKATNVKAELLDGERKYEQARDKPGSFYYYSRGEDLDDAGIIHSCPCGCGKLCSLPLVKQQGPVWRLTGSREKPTLAPSVGIGAWDGETKEADGYHWHGWLRDGVWVSA